MSRGRNRNRNLLETLAFNTNFFLIVLLCITAVCVVIYIFQTVYLHWSSDIATWHNLAYNMRRLHTLVPGAWRYGSDTFLYFPIPMALLMPFIRNQLLIHSLGTLVVVAVWVASLYMMSRYVFQDRAFFLLISVILLSGFVCEDYNFLIYGELSYTVRFTQIITIFTLFIVASDETFQLVNLRTPKAGVFMAAFVLITMQSLTVVQQYIFPLLAALTVMFVKEHFYDAHFTRNRAFKHFISTVTTLVILLIVSIVINQLIFAKAQRQPSDYVFINGETLLKNIQTMIINFTPVFSGIETDVNLFSVDGFVNLFKIVFGLLMNFVFPLLLIKNRAKLDPKGQLFIWFVLTYVITNIILVLFAFGEFLIGHARYFIVSQLLLFTLSGYYANEFIIKKSYMGKCMVYAALFIAICAYNLPRLALVDDANASIQRHRALTGYLMENNLSYGYATYWHSTHYTVLSNYDVMVLPVWLGEKIHPFDVLTADDLYSPTVHEGETFLLLTDAEAAQYPPENLVYGDPTRVLHYDGYTIYVYGYNLSQE